MLPLLLACTPDAALTPFLDTEAFLDPAVHDALPERAWIADPGEVTVGGQRLVAPDAAPRSEPWPVYEIRDDALGLVVEDNGVRLLVDVDRAALRPVLAQPALATPDAAGESDVGLLLPAGTPVDPDLAFHGAIPVRIETDWITGEGWVDAAAVDAYAELAVPVRTWTGSLFLTADTPLLDAPDGEPFATLTAEAWARTVGEPEDGWQRVELARRELTAVGYVPAPPPGHGLNIGGGGISGWSVSRFCGLSWISLEPPTVPVDTVLLDAPDGRPVALALRDLHGPVLDREDGYTLVEVETSWGPIGLWVE